MTNKPINVPPAWEKIDESSLRGLMMVVGAPDSGKSTFCRYLFRRLNRHLLPLAYLDGDPGQSTFGPPAAISLTISRQKQSNFPPDGEKLMWFIGAVSPVGHMLPVLAGAGRLQKAAREAGAQAIIFDTSGLIDPDHGGIYLKLAKIDLLQPSVLFALQREDELAPLLAPLRRSHRMAVIELSAAEAARRRDFPERQAHRADKFAQYFSGTFSLKLNWQQYAVFPASRFHRYQLVALENSQGIAIGLGIVLEFNRREGQVVLQTPLSSLENVDALRLGDICVDPQSFRDTPLNP